MNDFAHWDDLRSLLTTPSAKHFDRILELLHDEAPSSPAMQYAQEHLNDWDDALREGKQKDLWLKCPHTEPHPTFSLIRSFRTKDMKFSVEDFRTLFHSPHLDHIVHLHVEKEYLFGAALDEILYTSPLIHHITRLSLIDVSINADTIIARSPLSQHITHLDLSANSDDYFGGAGINNIASSPQLTKLTHLSLRNTRLWGDQLAKLLCMESLTHLDVSSNSICTNVKWIPKWSQEHREHLMETREYTPDPTNEHPPFTAYIKSLNISSCYLNKADEVAQLMGLPSFSQLEQLDASWAIKNDEVLQEIVTSPHVKQLKELTLSYGSFTSEGIKTLAQSEYLSNLKVLKIDSCHITDEGLIALAQSPYLQLDEVKLRYNDFSDEGVIALARSPILHPPNILDLSATNCGDKGLEEVLTSIDLRHCRELLLGGTQITDTSAKQIATNSTLTSLQKLSLSSEHIGDETLFALLHAPHLGQLRSLILAHTQITDAGLKAFDDAHSLHSLQEVCVYGSNYTQEGLQAFTQTLSRQGIKLLS